MDPHDLIHSLEEDSSGGRLLRGGAELDRVIEHIVLLLEDSAAMFRRSRFPTSAFLAITAIEETAKAHIGIFVDGKAGRRRRGNVFFSHTMKHLLAALDTVPMGERLPAALGKGAVDRLMKEARQGDLGRVRESALYFESNQDGLTVPTDAIDQERAKEMLLFAIEVFDDALVGFTAHSGSASDRTDVLFDEIAGV